MVHSNASLVFEKDHKKYGPVPMLGQACQRTPQCLWQGILTEGKTFFTYAI